ncbi:ECF transporter S component [Paenibacillus campi]|uniref:ECF transporter S component n=1 Tax=Paenibacillus campi TaxID=3106031 RepID=UPI002AFE6255|nr:ECF transporter S component [Paenibacillus sp. SGZ-1014]
MSTPIQNTMNKTFQAFTTMDIVLMALLATANAVMTMYMSGVNQLLSSLGGPILTSTITGLYMVYGLLAYYIIRKPGTAVITYALGALVQSFVGTSYGIISALAAAVCYMVIAEIIFAVLRYRSWSPAVMMLVGGAMVPIWFIVAIQLFGYSKFGFAVLAIAMVVRIISGMLLCGLLTVGLARAFGKTGLLRRFAAFSNGR